MRNCEKTAKLLKLASENPELPIIFEVDNEVVPNKDIYILNKGKYAKAPVVNVDGEKAVKMYGNVYVTKYDETRKAWLVNTKYGLYRF